MKKPIINRTAPPVGISYDGIIREALRRQRESNQPSARDEQALLSRLIALREK
jgi:hypothetical protein